MNILLLKMIMYEVCGRPVYLPGLKNIVPEIFRIKEAIPFTGTTREWIFCFENGESYLTNGHSYSVGPTFNFYFDDIAAINPALFEEVTK